LAVTGDRAPERFGPSATAWPPADGAMTFVLTVRTPEAGNGQRLISLRGALDKLEMARSLDAIANPLSNGVRGLLRGRMADNLHGAWLGRAGG